MKQLQNTMHGVLKLCAFLIVFITFTQASYIVHNDNIVSDRVAGKVNEMGSELFAKSGISVYVSAPSSLEGKSIQEFEAELSNELKAPYVLFTLAKNDQKVDITYTKGLEVFFDKEAVLSPYPWTGTVLPLLTQKKEGDKYNAAVLNGYADIVEQIAHSKDIKLESAIGDTNKDIYFVLKVGFYGFLLLMIFVYAYRVSRRRNG